MTPNPFRDLPSVDRVLSAPELQDVIKDAGLAGATEAARAELAYRRERLAAGDTVAVTLEDVVQAVAARATAAVRSSLRPVINATGVIIHTNLGRAPLSDATLAAMEAAGRGYSNLEYDLEAGERGGRHEHVEALICRITGAEAAMAVNNNAAALLMVLSTLAKEREVIISRGQLVEIGGGFRIPDVMAQSGATLVEVGTTNRTYIRDYESAISESTVALMHVHASNFRLQGFVAAAPLDEMVGLARERDLLVLDDLGSGCLLDTTRYGLPPEPTPQESLVAGTDLVMFSGDKLLGGPQAGIIAGRQDLVARLKRHPLARALRLDKVTIAGLNATLMHYARGEAEREVPVWRMISAPAKELAGRAREWAGVLQQQAPGRIRIEVIDGRSMIGGGSLPEESLATSLLAIDSPDVDGLARCLRLGEPAVVGRIERGRLLFDPRTVDPREEGVLLRQIAAALQDHVSSVGMP